MSRTLWFAAGAGASLYAVNRARRVREAFTADGLRDRASALALGARLVREEAAQARVEKENELRQRFGLVPHGLGPNVRAELETRRRVVSTGSTTEISTSSINGTERGSNN